MLFGTVNLKRNNFSSSKNVHLDAVQWNICCYMHDNLIQACGATWVSEFLYCGNCFYILTSGNECKVTMRLIDMALLLEAVFFWFFFISGSFVSSHDQHIIISFRLWMRWGHRLYHRLCVKTGYSLWIWNMKPAFLFDKDAGWLLLRKNILLNLLPHREWRL